jgi:hypothetical protein
MNKNVKMTAVAFAACFATLSYARECYKPPVHDSQQAACYATAYAERHGLRHVHPLAQRVTKGPKVWTVRFADTRPDRSGGGWDVDVDVKTGTVTRFRSYKAIER